MNPKRQLLASFVLFAVWIGVGGRQALAQEESGPAISPAPMPLSAAESLAESKPLTFAQQMARMQAEQRALRMEWYRWIGHSPLRPTINATHLSTTTPTYYIPSRGVMIKYPGGAMWYW
ncbi:MAG: hypothetical protein KatS3mg111_4068 [Pirellulaceae bacterium]|nr:MAG: hypothetical protein KatS3mg111_4068 [Pirellulaceae bacterium]